MRDKRDTETDTYTQELTHTLIHRYTHLHTHTDRQTKTHTHIVHTIIKASHCFNIAEPWEEIVDKILETRGVLRGSEWDTIIGLEKDNL